MQERIVVVPAKNISEVRSAELQDWTIDYINKNSMLKAERYWDVEYKIKGLGLVMPANITDTAALKDLKDNPVYTFILFTNILRINENDENALSNPNYGAPEASMNFLLYDVKVQKVVWQCTSRTRVSPIKVNDKNDSYSLSMPSGDFAVATVFKKSIKKLTRALRLNPSHKSPVNP